MKLFKKSKKHSSTSSATSTTPAPATAATNSAANGKESAPNTSDKGSIAEDAGAVALVSNSQKAGLVKRIEQLEELLRVSDEDLAKTREALKESREIAKEHNRSSSTVEKARDELEFRCQQLLEKYEEVKEENTKLQVQAEKANTEAEGLRSALEAKETELTKDKEYFFEQMERWEKKEKTLESQLVTASEPSSNSAAVSEDQVKIQALNKKISELEGQLVEMTGRAIMDGEVTELEDKIETLTKELESEKKAHSALQVQYKHLKDDSDVVQALLEDKSAKASQRLKEAEAEFDKAAAERQAEREEAFAQTKTLQTKLVDLEVTLKKSQARVLELEKLTKVQKEDFANLEKQRVAALDGKTAALLLAEREKVQVEEERKRAIEIEQVLLDQRQAMEAVIAAVREEERTNINNPHYSPQGSPCTGILSPSESLPPAKSPNTATSQESRSSFFGLFRSQRKKSHVESPAPKAKVDAEIHSPENQTNAVSSSTERVLMKVETKGQDQDDVEKKSAKVTEEEVSASSTSKEDLPEGEPRQLRLEEDNTDNTADVAAASLDYMSL